MNVGQRRAVALAIVVSSLVLIGLVGGCGDGDTASSSTAPTGAPTSTAATTTVTTAPTTSTTAATTTTTEAATAATRPTGLPTLADVEDYRQWLKMNTEPVQGRTHGLTDIYIDQERETIAPNETLVLPFPDGSTIVKEQLQGSLVAIMRKVEGIDPEHGDWQWIEYRTDGGIVGQDGACWSCHGQAESTDWVFTKLETP
ncbi:MAG: hypothetical protein V1912_01455 [bacterium]